MSFWDLFKSCNQKGESLSGLHEKVESLLPSSAEDEQILVACVAGLFARVIYIDFEVHQNEVLKMKDALEHWTKLSEVDINAIVELSLKEIKDLAGLENHKYAKPLCDILPKDQRYGLLESLFQIAASDGNVDEKESEEIRVIATGLLLEHKHFISARASVMEYLGALRA
ncbi:MAG: hypothetical protein CME70_04905 [Halobacteriovorax sp.]|nr:hypothetical protein [Halobacteriovorax sp.]|tara:strand:- start:20560 stop:21069 length:510 start_codon:yes stop_codon:yes gene_type:complete